MNGNRLYFKDDAWVECLRRVPRATIAPDLYSVWLVIPEISKMRFGVTMIGELGAYFLTGHATLPLKKDYMVDLELVIEDEVYKLEGRIRYVRVRGIAVEFVLPEEAIRDKIRSLFGPELLATTLSPLVSYSSVEPGTNSTMIFSDGEANTLQIGLLNDRISTLFIDLAILDLHLTWRRSALQKPETANTGEPIPWEAQRKVLNFVRNLPGLSSTFMSEIEAILFQGRFRETINQSE